MLTNQNKKQLIFRAPVYNVTLFSHPLFLSRFYLLKYFRLRENHSLIGSLSANAAYEQCQVYAPRSEHRKSNENEGEEGELQHQLSIAPCAFRPGFCFYFHSLSFSFYCFCSDSSEFDLVRLICVWKWISICFAFPFTWNVSLFQDTDNRYWAICRYVEIYSRMAKHNL